MQETRADNLQNSAQSHQSSQIDAQKKMKLFESFISLDKTKSNQKNHLNGSPDTLRSNDLRDPQFSLDYTECQSPMRVNGTIRLNNNRGVKSSMLNEQAPFTKRFARDSWNFAS